jgi:predicted  nucleic acid-binding Zn-ribbon protein
MPAMTERQIAKLRGEWRKAIERKHELANEVEALDYRISEIEEIFAQLNKKGDE